MSDTLRRRLAGLLWLLPVVAATGQDNDREVLANGGFDVDADQDGRPDGWNVDPQRIVYREIVPFGRDYEIVSRPGEYVLATQDVRLVPGETYTVVIEARGSGGGTAGALIVHGETKPVTEMPLIWRQRVIEEYATYAATFQAPNPVARLYIYNVARVGEVAYRRVSLIRGTPDYPLVRDLSFGAEMDPAEPPAETPHHPWATPLAGGPIRTLFALYSFRSIREHVELANRIELDYDLLHTGVGGKDASSPTGRRAQQRLIANEYHLYVVANTLPEAFRIHIARAVEAGAGLVLCQNLGRATGLFDPQALEVVGPDHYLRRDLPWGLLPADLPREVRAGELGGGRVVWLDYPTETTRVWGIWPVLNTQEDYRTRTLHHWEYELAFLARCFAWAARREQDVRLSATADAGGVRATVDGAPADARLELTLRSGREVRFPGPDLAFAPVVAAAPTVAASWPEGFPAGGAVADLRLLDADGTVLYWGGVPIERPRPGAFAELEITPRRCARGDPVTVAASATAAGRIEASLSDAFGRVYARQAVDGDRARIVLDTSRSLSAGNKLFVRLVGADGLEWDSRWVDIFLPEVNREQAWDDFHVTAWGDGYHNPVISHTYNTMMRELGCNGKLASFPYGSIEDGLWPTQMSGAPGYFPSGGRRPDRSRAAGCISDPAFFERADEAWAKNIPPQTDYGIVAWAIGDEIELTSRHAVDEVDFSPLSLAAFRTWLQERYGDLAVLNRQWDTAYATWDAVMPAVTEEVRGSRNYAPFVDFRTFMTDEWVKALCHATERIRALDPGARVGHTNTFGSLPFNGVDYWKVCTLPGFDWGQEYSEAIKPQAQKAVYAFWRSFCPEDMPNLGWIGYDHRPEAVRYEPWWLAFHGSRGVSYFATNACDAERGTSWALIHPTQQYSAYSRAVQAALADLVAGCGKALMETVEVEPEVAILWSHPSLLASWCESTWEQPEPPDRPPFDAYGAYSRSAFNLRLALEELEIPYRYVAPQQVASDAGLLQRYKVIFLPATCAIDEVTLDALLAYKRAGGLVVGDINLLSYDEHGTPWRERRPLEELFGVAAAGPVVWQPTTLTVRVDQAVESLAAFGHQPLRATAAAESTGAHEDGTPAGFQTVDGAGMAYLLNTLFPADGRGALALLDALTKRAGVARPVQVEPLAEPEGTLGATACSVARRVNGPIELVGVIRDHRLAPRDETTPLAVRIRFGREAFVTDLRERRQLGRVAQLETTMEAGQARLYALLPYRVTGLELTAPERARAGEDLDVLARVVADGGVGRHVLHVELEAPDGTVKPCYRRNVAAPDGLWRERIPLGLNDPPGRWTLRVRDLIGAVETARAVEVK